MEAHISVAIAKAHALEQLYGKLDPSKYLEAGKEQIIDRTTRDLTDIA